MPMQVLATTIKRDYVARIVAKELRIINGMTHPIREATVVVTRVRKNTRTGEYELHLGRVQAVKHWDRRRRRPR